MKTTTSLENILTHLEVSNAHTREHIQDKDHNNIMHNHNQRHIIIKSYENFMFNSSYQHNILHLPMISSQAYKCTTYVKLHYPT